MKNEKALFAANTLFFIQKARVTAQIRKTHLEKNDKNCMLTKEVLKRSENFEKWLNNEIETYVKAHPAYEWFKKVKGVGNLNIGKVLSLIDIEEATNISKLWRYAGFAVDNGRAEKQQKGKKLHYNKVLKSMCWRLAKSLIRAKGIYYEYYVEQKERLKKRFEDRGKKIVPASELPKIQGKKTEGLSYLSLGHLDMMAQRKMIKLFLSHLWLKWREAEGLSITAPYVHAIKNHGDYRAPEDFV